MSNIIKSGRTRNQGYLDLTHHFVDELSATYDGLEDDQSQYSIDEMIEQKKEELSMLELEIQKKREDADKQVEALLSEAISNSQIIEKGAADKKTEILAEAYQKQSEIVQNAENEAERIKASAHTEKKQMLEAVEGEVVETVITILEHLVSEEVGIHVEWLKLIVRKMMTEDHISESYKLFVSTHNLELIESDKEAFMSGLSKLADIVVDETLNDSTCILETEQGNIEYDVSQGLEKIITELRILKGMS